MGDFTISRDWTVFITPSESGTTREAWQVATEVAAALGWPLVDADHLASDEFAKFLGRTGLVVFTLYPPDLQEGRARAVVVEPHHNPDRAVALYNLTGACETAVFQLGEGSKLSDRVLMALRVVTQPGIAPAATP